MKKWANGFIGVMLLGVMLAAACGTASAQTLAAVTKTETVTSTQTVTATVTSTKTAAATNSPATTAPSTAVVPTTSAPPPTTPAVVWPVQITGQFNVSPTHAPVGSTVTATGTGYAANGKYDLMWGDVTGSWNVSNGSFFGRVWNQSWINLTPIQADAQGAFKVTFTVPDGFGFAHDLDVLEGGTTNGTIRGKLAFAVDMQITVSTSSGVLGSPITISIKGMGWRDYENSWMVLYDNKYTGVLTTTTTHGSGQAVITATGGTGKHIIQVLQGSWTFAFMNIAQSPFPTTPTWTFNYTITDGTPIMPPDVKAQSNPVVNSKVPADNGSPQIWTDIYLAPVGTAMNILGKALPVGAKVDLSYTGMTGNRVDGKGYEQVKVAIGTATVAANGTISYPFTMSDTHGGVHTLSAEIAGTLVAQTTFDLTPSAVSITPASGPVGTIMDIQLKGLGWTVTENNYYMVVDDAYVGYTCGFNNYGTIDIMLPIAGTPGWHYIDFYPGVYKGTETVNIDNFRVPYLTVADHPGENIPVLHFAFLVTG
jgi:hypothetical protein